MADMNTKFLEYDDQNPQVWLMFEQFANQLVSAGVKKLSANRIFERMRWESQISGNDGFKVNNNYRPYYARMYEAKYPNNPDFSKRASQADKLI